MDEKDQSVVEAEEEAQYQAEVEAIHKVLLAAREEKTWTELRCEINGVVSNLGSGYITGFDEEPDQPEFTQVYVDIEDDDNAVGSIFHCVRDFPIGCIHKIETIIETGHGARDWHYIVIWL